MRKSILWAACGLALAFYGRADASAVFSFDRTTVTTGSDVQVEVFLSGTSATADVVQGTDFFVQINDGGAANGGTSTAPPVSVDLVTNNNLANASPVFMGGTQTTIDGGGPLLGLESASIAGTVTLTQNTPKLFATLHLNTIGLSNASTFTVLLKDTVTPYTHVVTPASLGSVDIALSGPGYDAPQTFTVSVPEPSSALLLLFPIAHSMIRRRRV